jgi:aryl-alcohol dehydrogenase-like predicted oxidoreductase
VDTVGLGTTGVKVTRLCLGAMMFGGSYNADRDECVRIIDRALAAGVNFIDTADVYSRGDSEEIVGRALSGRRDDIVLATKVYGQMSDDPNERGNSRRWIMREVENSLRRLGTDWIDLYQIHRPDPSCDIDETLAALTDLVAAGKIRYAGHSTFPADQIVEAQWVAQRRGRERFVCEQPPYSILVRGIEADVLPVCQRYGLGVIVWGPLNAGWLAGGYRLGQPPPQSARSEVLPWRFDHSQPANQRKLEIVEQLALLAEEAGLSLIQLAIAFVLAHPAVTSVIAGPRTMEHLESYLAALEVRLDDDLLDRIDEIVPPGTNLHPLDAGWQPPSLTDPSQRRRRS